MAFSTMCIRTLPIYKVSSLKFLLILKRRLMYVSICVFHSSLNPGPFLYTVIINKKHCRPSLFPVYFQFLCSLFMQSLVITLFTNREGNCFLVCSLKWSLHNVQLPSKKQKKKKLPNANLHNPQRLWYVQMQICIYRRYSILLKFLHGICM